MQKIPRALLPLTASMCLAGCVTHTFVPGPGMSADDFEPQSAQCRLLARGADPSFSFGASGSPKFVAASMGGAALGAAIGTAVQRNENYNDCMEARGWRIADNIKQQPVSAIPFAAAAPAPAPVATSQQGAIRRPLGIRVKTVAGSLEYASRIDPPHGLVILSAEKWGAASAAGLSSGDVLLTFGDRTLMSPADLQLALHSVAPDTIVNTTIWRDDREHAVQIQF